MATYKIGNKVKGIIRSYVSGPIGNSVAEYNNEPFMRIENIEATLTFSSINRDQKNGDKNILKYNHDTITSVQLTGVPVSEKILSLLYLENKEAPLFHKQEYYTSDINKEIYINTSSSVDKIYQVFIYNQNGELERAEGELPADEPLVVEQADSLYSIYYSYLGQKSYFLNKPSNLYITLDLELIGNTDEQTQNMSLHIEKASIRVNRDMYLRNNGSNSIDIIADVIYTGLDYITVE